jgi:hypothetical protein
MTAIAPTLQGFVTERLVRLAWSAWRRRSPGQYAKNSSFVMAPG